MSDTTKAQIIAKGLRLVVEHTVANARVGMRCEYGTTAEEPLAVADAADLYARQLVKYAQEIRLAVAIRDEFPKPPPTQESDE